MKGLLTTRANRLTSPRAVLHVTLRLRAKEDRAMRKRLLTWRLVPVVAIIVALVCCAFVFTAAGADLAAHLEHRVTNVSGVSFTISWTTDTPCEAYIEYGDSSLLGSYDYDDRDRDTVSRTHHILIGYLRAETTYYYDIVCDGVRYDNGGKHYSATTGPYILPQGPHVIWGQVFKADGETPAEGSIVYMKIADADGKGSAGASQVWSRLVDSEGRWGMAFGTLRTSDLKEWFEFDRDGADNVVLEFEGATEGKTSLTVPTEKASTQLLPTVSLREGE